MSYFDVLAPDAIVTGDIATDVVLGDAPVGSSLTSVLEDIESQIATLGGTDRKFGHLACRSVISSLQFDYYSLDASLKANVICAFRAVARISDATKETGSFTTDAILVFRVMLIDYQPGVEVDWMGGTDGFETVFETLTLANTNGFMVIGWDVISVVRAEFWGPIEAHVYLRLRRDDLSGEILSEQDYVATSDEWKYPAVTEQVGERRDDSPTTGTYVLTLENVDRANTAFGGSFNQLYPMERTFAVANWTIFPLCAKAWIATHPGDVERHGRALTFTANARISVATIVFGSFVAASWLVGGARFTANAIVRRTPLFATKRVFQAYAVLRKVKVTIRSLPADAWVNETKSRDVTSNAVIKKTWEPRNELLNPDFGRYLRLSYWYPAHASGIGFCYICTTNPCTCSEYLDINGLDFVSPESSMQVETRGAVAEEGAKTIMPNPVSSGDRRFASVKVKALEAPTMVKLTLGDYTAMYPDDAVAPELLDMTGWTITSSPLWTLPIPTRVDLINPAWGNQTDRMPTVSIRDGVGLVNLHAGHGVFTGWWTGRYFMEGYPYPHDFAATRKVRGPFRAGHRYLFTAKVGHIEQDVLADGHNYSRNALRLGICSDIGKDVTYGKTWPFEPNYDSPTPWTRTASLDYAQTLWVLWEPTADCSYATVAIGSAATPSLDAYQPPLSFTFTNPSLRELWGSTVSRMGLITTTTDPAPRYRDVWYDVPGSDVIAWGRAGFTRRTLINFGYNIAYTWSLWNFWVPKFRFVRVEDGEVLATSHHDFPYNPGSGLVTDTPDDRDWAFRPVLGDIGSSWSTLPTYGAVYSEGSGHGAHPASMSGTDAGFMHDYFPETYRLQFSVRILDETTAIDYIVKGVTLEGLYELCVQNLWVDYMTVVIDYADPDGYDLPIDVPPSTAYDSALIPTDNWLTLSTFWQPARNCIRPIFKVTTDGIASEAFLVDDAWASDGRHIFTVAAEIALGDRRYGSFSSGAGLFARKTTALPMDADIIKGTRHYSSLDLDACVGWPISALSIRNGLDDAQDLAPYLAYAREFDIGYLDPAGGEPFGIFFANSEPLVRDVGDPLNPWGTSPYATGWVGFTTDVPVTLNVTAFGRKDDADAYGQDASLVSVFRGDPRTEPDLVRFGSYIGLDLTYNARWEAFLGGYLYVSDIIGLGLAPGTYYIEQECSPGSAYFEGGPVDYTPARAAFRIWLDGAFLADAVISPWFVANADILLGARKYGGFIAEACFTW